MKYPKVIALSLTHDVLDNEILVHISDHRPMNLMVIKKNIEKGFIRTTSEFQRDMMLMFTNAIMYNNKNQDVYQMAEVMYNDCMSHIEVRGGVF